MLALARRRSVDRWTSDRERAQRHANRNLVLTLASLVQVGGTCFQVGEKPKRPTCSHFLRWS